MNTLYDLKKYIDRPEDPVDINGIRLRNQQLLLKGTVLLNVAGSLLIIAILTLFDISARLLVPLEILTIFLQICGYHLATRTELLAAACRLVIYSSMITRLVQVFFTGGVTSAFVLFLPIYPMLTSLLLSKRETLLNLVLLVAFVVITTLITLQNSNTAVSQDLLYLTFLLFIFVFVFAAYTFHAKLNGDLSNTILAIANHDFLTRVLNRRAITSRLDMELNRARRENNWLSVMLIDIDHFKLFNDQHGHLEGDRCLITVAGVIEKGLRHPPDSIGRYGGEEFLVVLPNTNSKEAIQVAQRIRQSIANEKLRFGINEERKMTVTFGVISCKVSNFSGEQLINSADKCLYQGKAAGRDKIIHNNLNGPVKNTPRSIEDIARKGA